MAPSLPFLHFSAAGIPSPSQSICSSLIHSLLLRFLSSLSSHAASWTHCLIAGNLGIDLPCCCHAFERSWQTNLNPRIQAKNLHTLAILSHGVHIIQATGSRSHRKARSSKHRYHTFEIRETFCIRGASQRRCRRKQQAASVCGEDEFRWAQNCFLGGERLRLCWYGP